MKVEWIAGFPHFPPSVWVPFQLLIVSVIWYWTPFQSTAKAMLWQNIFFVVSEPCTNLTPLCSYHAWRTFSDEAGRESGGWLKRQNFCGTEEIHKNVRPIHDNESYTDLKQEILWYLWILGTEDFYSYIGRIPPLGILYTLKEIPQEFFQVSS